MANTLFITTAEIKSQSIINGNVDGDKFTEAIWTAQDLILTPLIGITLTEKLETLFIAGSGTIVAAPYSTLFNDYVKRGLIYHAASQVVQLNAFEFSNGGASKHEGENSVSVSRLEIETLVNKLIKIGEDYNSLMVAYIRANASDFPEYSETKTWEGNRSNPSYTGLDTPSGSGVDFGNCIWD